MNRSPDLQEANQNDPNPGNAEDAPLGENAPLQAGNRFPIVAIGASAGGLESLENFFRPMPRETGMAFVVLQHLSPDFKSMMDELLARHTSIPILRAEDGMEVMPDHIYLLPPKMEMIILGGRLHLSAKEPKQGLTLPIDHFFRSLAKDCGPNSVGVVLSGTGSDGSRGLCDISKVGGLVICESEQTAKFDGMPLSAQETGMVHLVLKPDEMAGALVQHARGELADSLQKLRDEAEPLAGTEAVFDLLRREYDIDFSHYKPTTVGRRIERRLSLVNMKDLEEYVEWLRNDPEELNSLYRDLLIGVTSFFRDTDSFDRLEREVIPSIIERLKPEDELRVWIAGCATGEEAYSIAILLHEAMERSGRPLNLKILATDVHKTSLDFASIGIYDESRLSAVSEQRLRRYFTRRSSGYQVSQDLRQLIVFAPHNVIKDAPFTNIDLITCRNLLIYFQQPAQKRALSLFHFGLKVGGVLFLGSSESPGELTDEFEVLDEHCKFYRKRRDSRLLADVRLPLARSAGPGGPPRPVVTPNLFSDTSLLGTYDKLLDRYMPPSLLVDEHRQILDVFGGAERMLRSKSRRPSNDLLDLLEAEVKPAVAGALQRAIKTQQPVQLARVQLRTNDETQQVRLSVDPIRNDKNRTYHFLITLEQLDRITPEAQPLSREDVSVEQMSSDQWGHLEEELRHTKENLQATIEELETANEEMQATNEELVASNEELQSTNEELHSVNEELYTVNAEHQRKIREMAELNQDMVHLLESADVATVFLDRELRIRKFTPRVADIFDLIDQDTGRKITSFTHKICRDGLQDELQRVLETEEPVETEVYDCDDRCYFMRILPYRTSTEVQGVVLTLVNISVLDDARRRIQQLSAIVESSEDAIFSHDLDGQILTWNGGAESIFGYTAKEAVGNTLDLLMPGNRRQELAANLERMRRGERVAPLETVWRTKSGEPAPVLLTTSPLRDAAGKVVGASNIARDIGELQKMQREIEQRAEQVHLLLNSTAEAICGIDDQGCCTFVNPSAVQMLGFESPNDLLGKSLHSLMHARQVPATNADAEEAVKDCTICQSLHQGERMHLHTQFWRQSGESFPVELWSHPVVRNGEPVGAVVTFMDITERQRLEERFRAAVEAAPMAMVMVNAEGQMVLVNHETERLFGYTRQELMGATVETLIPQPYRDDHPALRQEFFAQPEARRMGFGRDLHGLRKDGSQFPVEVGLNPMETNEGLFILSTIVDITERKKAEDEIREAVRRRDRFLAMLSHELRNPLSAARTATSLISADAVPAEVAAEARQVLDRQISHMTRLLDDLLDVSRFTQDKLQVRKQTVDLADSARQAIDETKTMAVENETRVECDLPEAPVWVYGDPSRLVQMQANMLANAIKYSPPGESVHLELTCDTDEAVVRIKDHGMGIPPHMLNQVFEMFVQSDSTLDRSRGGMGVGLTLVRSIVQLHGGTVQAKSDGEGKGSLFEVRLPLAGDAPLEPPMRESAATHQARKILLVEDQDDTRSLLSSLLELGGHEVTAAANGKEALEAFQQERFDVAVLDVGLPEISGYELARQLRQRLGGQSLRLIALTGYGQPNDIQMAHDAGFDHHLVKPLDLKELQRLLDEPLGEGMDAQTEEAGELSSETAE